jgi:hypothetical protein
VFLSSVEKYGANTFQPTGSSLQQIKPALESYFHLGGVFQVYIRNTKFNTMKLRQVNAGKVHVLSTLLLLICFTYSFGQKLSYDITLYGSKIGTMTIEKKDSAGLKRYAMYTKTEAKVFFTTRTSDSNLQVLLDGNGNLVSSSYKNIKNDGTITTNAHYENGKLKVEHNGEKSVFDGAVNLCSVLLYFDEPKKLQKVFSERAGKFFDMVKQSDGTYLAKLDDGSGKFTYTNNKLTQLEISKGILGTIVIKPAG